VVILRRSVKRPALTALDRGLLVLLASRLRAWASALFIARPETVLRWHRQGFRLRWRRKSAPRWRPSPLTTAPINLIKQLARDSLLWGAERIRDELLKLDIGVSKRTIQPTDDWVAQQREATPHGERPRFLLRGNDAKYGSHFARLAKASDITIVRTPVRAPRTNAIVERFLRSVRRECLDHLLLLTEAHLRHALGEYVAYVNQARPHQGCGRRVPVSSGLLGPAGRDAGGVIASPVLGGLHRTYRRAA
jgi:transposase InsO family protein